MRRKRPRFQGEDSTDEGTVNLTPLIDVVFVVLIMFIIVAPMLELDRVQLASGAPRSEKEMVAVQENSQISIRVHADNSIWLNNKKVTSAQLFTMLKDAKRRFPAQVPHLFHDKKAYFETYQTVKNAVELAGFEEMDVILQPN